MKRNGLEISLDFAHRFEFVEYPGQAGRLGYARADIERLIRFGYLRRERVLAVPPLPLEGPLFCCAPGGTKPDFAPVAHASSRFGYREATQLAVLFGTRKNASAFAGYSPSFSQVGQLTHDIHVTECLVAFRRGRQQEAVRWVSESCFMRRHRRAMGRFVPDAAICSARGGRLETAIEFAGASYTAERLTECWRAAWTAGMNLEIWAAPDSRHSSRSLLSTAS